MRMAGKVTGKAIKVSPIMLVVLGVLFAPVRADNLGYYVRGAPSSGINNGLGVKGTLTMNFRSFDSWPGNRPLVIVQVNIQDEQINNIAEGGLYAQQDEGGSWHLYIYMSVMDYGIIRSCVKKEEVKFYILPYKVQILRTPANYRAWQMWVMRPGSSSYELWNTFIFSVAWIGKWLESETEGYHAPSQGQLNKKIGEFSDLGWLDSNRVWQAWPSLGFNIYFPHVNYYKVSGTAWYSYITW